MGQIFRLMMGLIHSRSSTVRTALMAPRMVAFGALLRYSD